MDLNISDKVLKYEKFLNDVLKEELKKIHTQLDLLLEDMSEYIQLKNYIETLKDGEFDQNQMKTQIDIGSGFYLQANVDDPSHILISLGCGYFVNLSLDEGLKVIKRKLDFMHKQCEIFREQSSNTKAHIKMVLLGLMELQNL